MNINIKEIEQIKDELHSMKENDVLFIDEDDETKYVIMPIEMYDSLEEARELLQGPLMSPRVDLVQPEDFELTYDEYERVKNQIMEIIEKTLMPKPEKLN